MSVDFSKRTKGPWHVFKATNGYLIGIGEETGEGIFDSGFGVWRDGPEALANAAFIVHAANCHDELVYALGDAQRRLCGAGMLGGDNDPVNAAYAKAKGETP